MERMTSIRISLTLLITALFMTNAVVVVTNQQASASHYHNFPAGSDLVNDNFGYSTTFTGALPAHGAPAPDITADLDHSWKLNDNITPNLFVDGESAPGLITEAGFVNAMTAAMNDWENSVGVNTDMPRFTMVGDVENDETNPSLWPICGGDGRPNGRFEVAFCAGPAGADAAVRWSPDLGTAAADGGIDFYTEADMVFNSLGTVNTEAEIENVGTHELGHMLGLGDMYNIYGGSSSQCDTTEQLNGPPVMCGGATVNVARGDINGIYYLYPEQETVAITSTEDNEQETDMAIAGLSGSTRPEFVILQVNEDVTPSPDEQHFVIRPYQDVNENTYLGTAGVQEELTNTGFPRSIADIKEVGLSIVNIAQGSNPEMIVSWIESSNIGYWRVYWDVALTSGNLGWSGASNIQTMPTLLGNTEGIDTVFMNMDGDPALEMVVIKCRLDGGSSCLVYYSYVELDGSTGAASGSWTHVNNPAVAITLEDDKIGAGIIQDGDRVVAIANKLESGFTQEYIAYRAVRFNTDGTVDEVSIRQVMPLESISGTIDVDGFGADAYNWQDVGVTGPQYKDLVGMWLEAGTTYFVVDRDSKYNAHGDSDNTTPGGVTLDAEDCSGNIISPGMAVSLYNSAGNLLQSGFTPMYYDITATGTYLVKYSNYGSLVFVKPDPLPPNPPVTGYTQYPSWGGDVNLSLSTSVPYRVVGVYTSSGTTCPGGMGSITIRAERADNQQQIDGLYVQLQNSGHVEIANGFTTVTFPNLAAGTYYAYPNDFAPYFFSHWKDTGSTVREREVILGSGQTPTYTAVYNVVP